MFPLAITCGNTYVLKPSERVPNTAAYLVKLLQECKLPPGVLNIVNGGWDTTKAICAHPDIRAISFVGGNQAGDYIYENGAKTHKRM
jgi:malonate-semialdehyde dehydrogenase (acetylating)/methylmalonate-semialdehyde dehydrogenase